MNIYILGISELNWTGWANLTQMTIISYCEQESLRSNGVALVVNKRVQNAALGCNLKNDDICSFPRQTILSDSNPSLCPNH